MNESGNKASVALPKISDEDRRKLAQHHATLALKAISGGGLSQAEKDTLQSIRDTFDLDSAMQRIDNLHAHALRQRRIALEEASAVALGMRTKSRTPEGQAVNDTCEWIASRLEDLIEQEKAKEKARG